MLNAFSLRMLILEHTVHSKNSDNRKNVGFKTCGFYSRGSEFDHQSVYIQFPFVILSCFGQIAGTPLKTPTIAFFPIKVKLSLPTPWKRTVAVDTQLYLFLTSALDGGEWLILSHGKELPVLVWRWVGPRAGLDVLETMISILPLPEFESRTVQPVA